jgi:PAS domain S-box-containing protein
VAGWQDGRFLTEERLDLRDLPDADVLLGGSCIHPSGLRQLMPAVVQRLGESFDAYAGLPLRAGDGEVMGLIGGYARRAIRDPAWMRSLLGGFASHATDGLHRRTAGLELRANQDRFEALARHSQDLLTETDSQGNLTYASDAAMALLGYRREELVGRPIFDFVHPEDRRVTADSFEALLSGREPPCHVTRALHADGSWRWLESRVSGFTAADGSFRVLSLSRDITQQRYDTLGRNLLYSVVQQGADLVLVCEIDTTIRYANAVATRLLAAAGDSSIEGQSLLSFLAPHDASTLELEVLPQLEEIGGWSGEIELLRPDSTEPLPTEASVFLFSDPDASTRPLLAVTLHDITERRAAEAVLRETESRLGQAQKMEAVGRLAGGIAHDFNNLLTAIIGYGDLLLDELGPDHRARRDAEEILNAAERAGGLTRQLLAFSRRQVLQPELIDLNRIVADIDRLIRRLIGEDIQIVTMQDGGLAPILADPSQIEQVILNLVVNARDAMPHGGRLEIETHNLTLERPMRTDSGLLEAGDYVELRVRDTGVGMDAATHARMFEPFFTTKTPDRGTGLGLATVYGIVSQSGGQIEAESRLGEGSTFHVYLPTAKRQRIQRKPEEPVEAAVGGEETILLVEDSDVVRGLVERTLRAAGYRVLTTDSATGALRHCSRHPDPIALLLTDVVLPRIDGPEIALRAREIRPTLRVLFMSGFSEEKLLEHGIAREEPNLIAKPFTPSDLLHAIRRVLDEPTEEQAVGGFHVEQMK